MTTALSIESLTVRHGATTAVDDLNLEVRVGEVFGFLGPNGAGKSTTIRTLLGLIRPDAGTARILGVDMQAAEPSLRRRVGFLPGDLALFAHATGRETLELFAALYGTDCPDRDAVFARFRFPASALDRPVKGYSTGMRQTLGIALAFQHRPEVLVLDEPTTGLDPLARDAFLALVADARARGATVFLSSHVLDEVDRLADRIAVIAQGKLRVVDTVERLRASLPRRVTVRRKDGTDLVFDAMGPISALLDRIRGLDPEDVEIAPVPLDAIFQSVVQRRDA